MPCQTARTKSLCQVQARRLSRLRGCPPRKLRRRASGLEHRAREKGAARSWQFDDRWQALERIWECRILHCPPSATSRSRTCAMRRATFAALPAIRHWSEHPAISTPRPSARKRVGPERLTIAAPDRAGSGSRTGLLRCATDREPGGSPSLAASATVAEPPAGAMERGRETPRSPRHRGRSSSGRRRPERRPVRAAA